MSMGSVPPPAISPAAPKDAQLVRRLQRRDPLALAALYDRYGVMIYSIALHMISDVSAAEDLTEETFLSTWNRIGKFDPTRESLAAWMCALVRVRALRYLGPAQARLLRAAMKAPHAH